MSEKVALIIGVSGQDGGYLARSLVNRGYKVYGTSRDAQRGDFENLNKLGVSDRIELVSMAPTDFRSVLTVIGDCEPDEIYNLSGQSSVGLSFQQPVETMESVAIGTLNILEAMRFLGSPMKLFNSCSGECFGDTKGRPANEQTPFRPRSPYAFSKAAAYWMVANYRDAYGLFACSGIMFNHESPMRPSRFVTQKVVAGAREIVAGRSDVLILGNMDISRDWGWAPDYVEAMSMMLEQDKAEDFVLASGVINSLRKFVDVVFSYYNLDYENYVASDPGLFRPSELESSCGDASKAKEQLGWTSDMPLDEIVRRIIEREY